MMDSDTIRYGVDAGTCISEQNTFMIRQHYISVYFLRDWQEIHEQRYLKNISILFNDIKKTGPGYGYGYRDTKKDGGGYYSE